MSIGRLFPLITLAACLAGPLAAQAGGWGSLSGQILVTGDIPKLPSVAPAEGLCPAVDVPEESLLIDSQSGGLQNVAVYLKSPPSKIHPDLAPVPTQPAQQFLQDCRFIPRMLFVRTGHPVELFRDDPVDHSLRWHGFHNAVPVRSVPAHPEILRLANPEKIPLKVTCDIHPYMTGWWIVLDHPYAAISSGQGRFQIPKLPTGEHELTIWHERKGYIHKSLRVLIEPGDNVLPVISVPIHDLVQP